MERSGRGEFSRDAPWRAWIKVTEDEASLVHVVHQGPPGTWTPMHCNGQLESSSVRHAAAPNWVPLSCRGPLPLTPLSTAIPGSQAQLFQPQTLMGSRGPTPHSHLDPCPRLLESSEPCSQLSCPCQNRASES